MIREIGTAHYDDDHDHDDHNDGHLRMGLIMVNLTNPMQEVNMISSPMLWSRPVPLGKLHLSLLLSLISIFLLAGWYFHQQWQRYALLKRHLKL